MRGIACPRDVFLTMGNEIIESPNCMRSRWYEYLNLRPLFEKYFHEDPEFIWVSAPKPRLTDESYEPNYNYNFRFVWSLEDKQERKARSQYMLTEKEPLWDGADSGRAGKDIFWYNSAVSNKSGIDWIRRYFGTKGIRVHVVTFADCTRPWHIDCSFTMLHPGKAMYNPSGELLNKEVIELFKLNDWEMIPAVPPVHVYQYTTSLVEADHYENFTAGQPDEAHWISMNTLSLGPKTICVEAHETLYQEQLDTLGMEVVPVEYDQVLPFGGELHCTTLDVYREGGCEDYFPKQIPGV